VTIARKSDFDKSCILLHPTKDGSTLLCMKAGMGQGQPEFNFNPVPPPMPSSSSMEQSEKEKVAKEYDLYGSSLDHLNKRGNQWFYDDTPIEKWDEMMKELDEKNGDWKNY